MSQDERENAARINRYIEQLWPDEQVRTLVLSAIAKTITQANLYNPLCWGINVGKNDFRVTVRHPYVIWIEGKNQLWFHCAKAALDKIPSPLFDKIKDKIKDQDPKKGNWWGVTIHFPEEAELLGIFWEAHCAFIKKISTDLYPQSKSVHLRSGVYAIKYMREFLNNPEIPQPGYYDDPVKNDKKTNQEENWKMEEIINNYFASQGLSFSPSQVAAFYTALQTKGFVILSGISGTGKTKLAQYFARFLRHPIALVGAIDDSDFPSEKEESMSGKNDQIASWWTYAIQEDVTNSLRLPFRLYIYHNKKISYWHEVFDYKTKADGGGFKSPWPEITPEEDKNRTVSSKNPTLNIKTWFKASELNKPEKVLDLQKLAPLFNYKNVPGALVHGFRPILDPLDPLEPYCLFVSVRTDWRDSKSLLGYYNPLSEKYEKTEFLRFLECAYADYQKSKENAVPWFVILDEMNLARVEYYFADLLSVLESGRDDDGWTKEELHFEYPVEIAEKSDKPLPLREMKIPPNLYIIGTVNVDETTHSFSPKVLDRAFTIELRDVDFSNYPADSQSDQFVVPEKIRQQILENFSRESAFVRIDKAKIAKFVKEHNEYRQKLIELNNVLESHDMHFGYRVFDEIMMFLVNAEGNELFSDLEKSFDEAVLMKVLPKFHGSRARLQKPLEAVLEWSCGGEKKYADIIENPENNDTDGNLKIKEVPQYPQTANKVLRMLNSIRSTGFASFS